MRGSEILKKTLKRWAEQTPDKECIIETATDRRMSYTALFRAVTALQAYFTFTPQTVIIATPGGIINSIVWLTTTMYGHLLIPVSPHTTAFEYKELLEKYKPTLLITETKEWITDPQTKQLSLSEIETIITQQKTIEQADIIMDGKIYLATSGSTGKPKEMILTASQIVITSKNICKKHELTHNDRCLTPLPFYHVNAPIVSLISTVITGGTVIIAPKFSASHFWEWVEKYKPTWISIVPTIIAILLKFDVPAFLKNSSVRFVRTASSPLPKANLLKFEEKFELPVIETYGISEAGSTIFSNPLPPKAHKPGSVGLPIGITVKLINTQTKKQVQSGEIGEIWVKGEQVISHYEDGKGADSFEDGWFKTGDLGYLDEDGYLFITGRKKEIIIRGGENIIPREIEELLITYPGIVEAAVVGHPEPILGEKVVAFIVTEGIDKNETNKIVAYMRAHVSPQKVPAEIYILDTLPRGKTNKIDKNALKNDTIQLA
jgi:acyl-CoA synthetase (AMP-forming)/AMP-acid ligase II